MRARAGAGAAAVALLVSCTGGDGAGEGAARPAASTTSPASATTSTGPAGASTTTVAAVPGADPPGSVTLRATRFVLPAGAGLRVVVSASSPRLTVRRRGSAGALSVCPVPDATSTVSPAGCVDLGAGRDVDLGSGRGVEIRAGGAGATVDEVTVTYLPRDRSTTVVMPSRPAGSCAATACQATFSLSPSRGGSFALAGRAGGGRARLTLRAEGPAGGGSRVLATAEGGAGLSITATVEPSIEAVLEYNEQVDGAVAPLVMEISWP